MEKSLGTYSLIVSPEMTNSHVEYKVPISKGLVRLSVEYSIGKIWEENPLLVEKEWRQYHETHPLYREQPKPDEGILNLITLSISSPSTYFGSAHRFTEGEVITIGRTQSSLGFIYGELEAGVWRISINCHAVVSENLFVHCQVYGEFEGEVENQKGVQLVAVKDKKERPQRELGAMRYHKVELHAHTHHSDAVFSTQALLDAAAAEKIEYLAITDHNTMAPFYDEVETELTLIQGMELTTFFGHILLHSGEPFAGVDWTELSEQTINQQLTKLKQQGLLIGMAHPFSLGTPYCTGCQWNYVLDNLNLLDYIEVWNSFGPHLEPCNLDAFAKWTQLLDQGIQIPASCGRDWHGVESKKAPSSIYVQGVATASPQAILTAVAMGQSYLTTGPSLDVLVNDLFSIGDYLPQGGLQFKLVVKNDGGEQGVRYAIESNCGDLARGDLHETQQIDLLPPVACCYLRISLFNEAGQRIAFTNPFYFGK